MTIITTKFDSRCHTCKSVIRKGASCEWTRDEDGKGHVYCDSQCQEQFKHQDDPYEIPDNPDGIPQGPDPRPGPSSHGGEGDSQGKGKQGQGGDRPPMKHHETGLPDSYTKRAEFIRDALEKGYNSGEIYQNVKPRIGKDERWTKYENTGEGKRGEAKSQQEQESSMNYYIRRQAAEWEKDTGKKQGEGQGEAEGQGQLPTPPEKESPLEYFYRRVLEIRKFCDTNAGVNDATRLDQISLRPVVNGIAAIKQGINPDALLHAMVCHWPDDKQKDVGVKPLPIAKMGGDKVPGEHESMGYVLALAKARVPIMLVGPAGTGKSFLARALARIMFDNDESHYGEAPLTAGAMPSWLIGAETVAGYKSRPFLEIYEKGGVFNFEEIDAADANMLMVLNNALAQDRFYNPANGRVYTKHEDFIAVSTGNTWGMGANRFYNAREKLDFATRDRWRMGRVYIHLDTKVERGLVDDAIKELA